MKLTSAQVERTMSQFEVQALPDNHPAVPELNELFGEHTFLLDSNGLNILEPAGWRLTSPSRPEPSWNWQRPDIDVQALMYKHRPLLIQGAVATRMGPGA